MYEDAADLESLRVSQSCGGREPVLAPALVVPGVAVCEIHRLTLMTLKGGLVRRSHNLPHCSSLSGGIRELARAEAREIRIGTIPEPIGTI